MSLSHFRTLLIVVPLYAVACAVAADPGQTGRIGQPVATCGCGKETAPWTAVSPNVPGTVYVDPAFANQWAVEIPSEGERIMGQYSKPMTFFG
jgi:hypothetical protein